ncbi:hypothetical protein JCM8097_002641 [Rhodosporidiobolus ruineniae]
MCWSSAGIFYGTFVRAIPLFMAADAWTCAQPVFLALDMISRRRRRGLLQMDGVEEGSKTVASLPVEVLEQIKKAVIDVEISAAQFALARSFGPEDEVPGSQTCFFPFECRCDWCHVILGERGGMAGLASEWKNDVLRLLNDFNLSWPGQDVFSLEGESYDTDSLAAVAIPFHIRSRSFASSPSFPESSHVVLHGPGDSHQWLQIDPAAFTPPLDTHSRFSRFLSLFSLYTYNPSADEVIPASLRYDGATAVQENSDERSKPKLPARTSELKPQPGPLKLAWHFGSWSQSCM